MSDPISLPAWLMSAFMGILQGITEYIPVSSTGHLILLKKIMSFQVDDSFEVFIQAGSVLAVLLEYHRRFRNLLDWRSPAAGFRGVRGCGLLALTTVPAVITGFFLHDWIARHLYADWPVAVALGLGGLVMIVVEWWMPARKEEEIDQLRWGQALGVGIFQCVALIPGVSRSASTIIGGRVMGLGRKTATEYSFFAAVPVLTLAALYVIAKAIYRGDISWVDFPTFAIGFVVSFLFSWLAIRFLIRFVARHTLAIFGWYRVVLFLLLWWILG